MVYLISIYVMLDELLEVIVLVLFNLDRVDDVRGRLDWMGVITLVKERKVFDQHSILV